MDTEALNAFGQAATELTNHEDCLVMAELFFEKNLTRSSRVLVSGIRSQGKGHYPAHFSVFSGSSCRPRKKTDAEALILAIEKSNPKRLKEAD